MKRIVSTLLAVVLFCGLICASDAAFACPTCKEGMAGDPAYSNMVNGYFWSIIFMMSMPFLVLTGISAYFYYEVCRARSRQAMMAAAALANDGGSTKASDAGSSEVGPGTDILSPV